ncbi:MAG: riboflavin biosynthesis protein RibF [Deinococcales bacterium]
MRVYQSVFDRPKTQSVVAIGSFDGLHLGHRALFQTLTTLAMQNHLPSVLFTFDQPTRVLLEGSKYLYSFSEKLEILSTFGVSEVVAVPFTKEFSSRAPQAFLEDVAALMPKNIVVGYDFRFGHQRAGGISDLEIVAPVQVLEMQTLNGQAVHASAIRALLEQRDIRAANAMLGREFHAAGVVIHGQQLGRTIGTPTANIAVPEGKLLPKGVYAVRLQTPDGKHHKGVANIGTRPTIGGMTESFEVFLFDFSGDLYGLEVSVRFVDFVREERKFISLEELKQQLELDKQSARAKLQ